MQPTVLSPAISTFDYFAFRKNCSTAAAIDWGAMRTAEWLRPSRERYWALGRIAARDLAPLRAAWAYFGSFPQAAKDFAELAQTKLTMPVLSIGGEKSLGEALAQQMKLVASDVTVVVLKDTGHWVLEERPKETTDALVKFL